MKTHNKRITIGQNIEYPNLHQLQLSFSDVDKNVKSREDSRSSNKIRQLTNFQAKQIRVRTKCNSGISHIFISRRRFIVASVLDALSPRYRSLPDRHLQLASNFSVFVSRQSPMVKQSGGMVPIPKIGGDSKGRLNEDYTTVSNA